MQRHIPEIVVPGKRLGRHVNHDPRSLRYLVKPRAALATSVLWKRTLPILDQGNLGSCTGNATVGSLGTEPHYSALPAAVQASLNEALAIRIYSEATALDKYSGTYPPDDTGSDGLSAAAAAKKDSFISGYVHATSIDAAITALQTGPIITGVNWYDSFDQPNSDGLVAISANAQVRGGHEFEILGVDVDRKMFFAANSWSAAWAAKGFFQFGYDTYDRLLHEQGDATSLLPLSVPAPTPRPVDDADAALVAAGNHWEPSVLSRFTRAGKFKGAFDDWKHTKGYV